MAARRGYRVVGSDAIGDDHPVRPRLGHRAEPRRCVDQVVAVHAVGSWRIDRPVQKVNARHANVVAVLLRGACRPVVGNAQSKQHANLSHDDEARQSRPKDAP